MNLLMTIYNGETMKLIFLILSIFAVNANAQIRDRQECSRGLDKDFKLCVNDGGVVKYPLSLIGSTGNVTTTGTWTFGDVSLTGSVNQGTPTAIGAGTITLNVANKSFFTIGNQTTIINNLSGGIQGQHVYIMRVSSATNLTLKASNNTGGDPILMQSDLNLQNAYGVTELVFNGTNWFVTQGAVSSVAEGTFTATLYSNAAGTNSTTTTGYYVKNGKVVHVTMPFTNFAASGWTTGGVPNILGLPFTLRQNGANRVVGSVWTTGITFSSTLFTVIMENAGGSPIYFYTNNNGSPLTATAWNATGNYVYVTMTYVTD